MFISGIVSARVAQEASPSAAGTRNAIVGRVVNQAGRPVPGVFVTVLHVTFHTNGLPRVGIVRANFGVRTNAHGAYRLENLPLGPLYVVALPENPPLGPDGSPNRAGYGHTYHPEAATRDEARKVTVAVTGPVVADITLLPATLASISGTVIGQDGKPAADGMLGIAHGDGMFGVHSRAMKIRADGTFVLPALPPATYLLQFREGPLRPPPGSAPKVSGAKVVLAGRDLSGVRVVPLHRVRATGRIVIDRNEKKLLTPAMIRVSGFPVTDGMPGTTGAPKMNADLSFVFEVWPGPNIVRVRIDQPGWVVKAIRYKGTDVTKMFIDFKEGQPVDGIEIEVARTGPR